MHPNFGRLRIRNIDLVEYFCILSGYRRLLPEQSISELSYQRYVNGYVPKPNSSVNIVCYGRPLFTVGLMETSLADLALFRGRDPNREVVEPATDVCHL